MAGAISCNAVPRRRFWQFRLRSVLVLIFVLSLPCAWLGIKFAAKRRERLAVAYVERLGGSVMYHWQVRDDGSKPAMEAPGPKWVKKLLGDDLFTVVTSVDLSDTSTTDDDVARLASGDGLREIYTIQLSGTQLTDAGLRNLASFSELQSLFLSRTSITGSGLGSLKVLPKLGFVELAQTRVADAGISELACLTDLGLLDLSESSITDAALPQLAKLQNLQWLFVWGTRVTDRGLAALDAAPSLYGLGLDSSHLTDEGIANLRRLLGLNALEFSAPLTDAETKRIQRDLHVYVGWQTP